MKYTVNVGKREQMNRTCHIWHTRPYPLFIKQVFTGRDRRFLTLFFCKAVEIDDTLMRLDRWIESIDEFNRLIRNRQMIS